MYRCVNVYTEHKYILTIMTKFKYLPGCITGYHILYIIYTYI